VAKPEESKLVEVDATDLFEMLVDGGQRNWDFCDQHAQFSHREACEFIVHVGSDFTGECSIYARTIAQMRESRCTEEFIATYVAAKEAGAIRVLYYA
jgi:hypothetical protein